MRVALLAALCSGYINKTMAAAVALSPGRWVKLSAQTYILQLLVSVLPLALQLLVLFVMPLLATNQGLPLRTTIMLHTQLRNSCMEEHKAVRLSHGVRLMVLRKVSKQPNRPDLIETVQVYSYTEHTSTQALWNKLIPWQ